MKIKFQDFPGQKDEKTISLADGESVEINKVIDKNNKPIIRLRNENNILIITLLN